MPVPSIACRVFQDCRLIELSIGGAFVESPKPLPPGTEADIEFALPSGAERLLRASMRVEWAGDYFAGRGTPCLGMGLSFRSISAEDRVAITEFLRKAYDATRGALRVSTRLPVKLRTEERTGEGLVRELGERAIFVETTAVAGLGAEVEIVMRLPNATSPVAARGVVLRVEPAGRDLSEPPNGGGPRGLRIEFRALSVAARELIKGFLDDTRREADG
jgi:Tfp pilus assembly protein PilZ